MAAFAAQNVAPPPPPPVVGSAQWLKSKEHALVAPGPEAAQSGLNMAMYQAGPIAVNLADYLRHKADDEEVRTGCTSHAAPASCRPASCRGFHAVACAGRFRPSATHLGVAFQGKAELSQIVLDCLKQAQPCELTLDDKGVVKCKAGTGIRAAA